MAPRLPSRTLVRTTGYISDVSSSARVPALDETRGFSSPAARTNQFFSLFNQPRREIVALFFRKSVGNVGCSRTPLTGAISSVFSKRGEFARSIARSRVFEPKFANEKRETRREIGARASSPARRCSPRYRFSCFEKRSARER